MFKTSISLVLPLTLELAKAKDSLSQLFLKLAWVCCLLVLLGHTQNFVGGFWETGCSPDIKNECFFAVPSPSSCCEYGHVPGAVKHLRNQWAAPPFCRVRKRNLFL